MFHRLNIKLSGPICSCSKQNLAVNFDRYKFKIWCKTCNTELVIPKSKFYCSFNFDVSYPEENSPVLNKKDNVITVNFD